MKTFQVPYQPGVAWTYRDRYPCPSSQIGWRRLTQSGTINIVGSNVGLIETLGGMAVAESLSNDVDVVWRTNQSCKDLLNKQSLVSIGNVIELPKEVAGYKVPFFIDADQNQYLNISYNKKMSSGTLMRVLRTSCRPYREIVWRKAGIADALKQKGIDSNAPIVLIVPEATGWSRHTFDAMRMTVQEVRELLASLVNEGIQPVLMIKEGNQYNYMITHHGKIFSVDLNLNLLIELLKISKGIVSRDIDCIMAALMVGESKIFAVGGDSGHSLMKNAKYIGSNNHIYTTSKLEVKRIIQQLRDSDGRMATNRYWFREGR